MIRKEKKRLLGNDFENQKVVEKIEMIYKEIAEDDKRLAEDFLSIRAYQAVKDKAGGKEKKKLGAKK